LIQIAAPAFCKAAKQENEMRKLNCKPGDLAVIVTAYNLENIGTILRVLKTHKNQKAVLTDKEDHIWLAVAPRPMTYEVSGKLIRRKRGAVPDSVLRPIRGLPFSQEKKKRELKFEDINQDEHP
jgi:hypothetical protein